MRLNSWLLFFGLALLLLGLVIHSVVEFWDARSLVVIAVGLVLTVVTLIRMDLRKIVTNRRFLYGGNMAVVIILVIAIIGLLNFLLARYSWRVDTTAGRAFSLSDQTVKVLKGLQTDVDVIAFEKDINRSAVEDLLAEYEHISNRFHAEIVDPDKRPTLAEKYNIRQYGNLVVIAGAREEQISESTEEDLTNAIIKVTRQQTKTVAFVTGHGERSISNADQDGLEQARQAIEAQNYQVKELLLADLDSIPETISVLVIAGPRKRYFAGELDRITPFLNCGGGVLFMLDPNPGYALSGYLEQWNLAIGRDLVVDASGFGRLLGAGPEIPLVTDYGDHPITEDMSGLMTFFPLTRSVSPLDTNSTTQIVVTVLARTGAHSYAIDQAKVAGDTEYSIGPEDRRGPIAIACAAQKTLENGQIARLVAVGDCDFASNAYFDNQANGDLFLNMINWLMADEDLISIRPRDPELRLVHMTPGQISLVFWITVVLLPVAAFGCGVLVYIRRR